MYYPPNTLTTNLAQNSQRPKEKWLFFANYSNIQRKQDGQKKLQDDHEKQNGSHLKGSGRDSLW